MSILASSILLLSGLVRREQLLQAQKLHRQLGGTLGEALIHLGVVDEEQLVEYYHRRLMIPRMEAGRFEHVAPKVLEAVPADMAAEFRVFPVEIDSEGILTLAMADPADTHVADEVAFFTNRFCQRAVAAESILRTAIEKHYRINLPGSLSRRPGDQAIAPAGVQSTRSARGDDTIKRVSGPRPNVMPAPHTPLPSVEPPPVLLTQKKGAPSTSGDDDYVTYTASEVYHAPSEEDDYDVHYEVPLPGMAERPTPIPLVKRKEPVSPAPVAKPTMLMPTVAASPGVAAGPPPVKETIAMPFVVAPPVPLPKDTDERATRPQPTMVSVDPPLARLRKATSRDEIADALLDYVAGLVPRALLFVVRHGLLAGYDGRGSPLDLGAVHQMVIAMDAQSLFRDVIRSRLPYRGPLPDTPPNRTFSKLLGTLAGEVLLLPLSVRDRVIALVYADGLSAPLPDGALHQVSRETGLAYERLLVVARK